MTTDFKNIDYLLLGNNRQKLAYSEIKRLAIFEILVKHDPILTGTIPIEIDIPQSDLDIICCCQNHQQFSDILAKHFGGEKDFSLYSTRINGVESTIAEFKTPHFTIEIFGQNKPTEQQNAYKHMLIERQILEQKGVDFKNEIISLKLEGLKTEPAFALLLKLEGDPYEALLKYNAID